MKKIFLGLALICGVGSLFAQENYPPVIMSKGVFLGESLPLRDAETAPVFEGNITDQFRIDQRFTYTGGMTTEGSADGFDPLVQTEAPLYGPLDLEENFDGINIAQAGGSIPPDPSGAVGPDHYVTAVNLRLRIFDKAGTSLAGPINLNTVFGIGGNGDPIVMYDQLADRFFVSQFRTANNALLIAVSTTADPTGSYYVYQYPLSTFPDYPHYAVWPNAYFLTANKGGQTTYAFDREIMLSGGEDPALVGFSLPGVVRNPNTVFSPEPANLLGRVSPTDAPGYIVYLQDDAWTGVNNDHLKIWTLDIDFDGTSSISAPVEIPVQPFDSFFSPFGSGDFSQPGTNQRIDGIGGVISYMANFRSFDGYNSLLVNFNSDIGSQLGGIRWIELRNVDNGPFSVFQEGTYALGDDLNRFMGSMSIDKDGNFGLAYNVSSSSVFPGLRFTGRMADDPMGLMTIAETTIIEGEGGVGTFNRFGDYSQMTMDIDNRTFWFTGEYMGDSNNFWKTRITSFTLGDREADDVAVYGFLNPLYEGPFTDAEVFTARVANFGTNPQSNFEIELRLDGVLMATDTYDGTLNPGEVGTHEFSVTLDLLEDDLEYLVSAKTLLASDTYNENDEFVYNYLQEEILGVNENSFATRDLLIYPLNDGIYEINLATNSDYGNVSYDIFDITGKKINSGDLTQSIGGYKTQVNMAANAKGVYIVKIDNANTSMSKKILVR